MSSVLNSNAVSVIKRNIERFGKLIEFKRPVLDKYKQVTDEFEITETQKAIFHSSNDFANVRASQADSGKSHGERREMLLTYANENIKVEDYCNVGNKFYRIYAIIDYDNKSEFFDLCLEEVEREQNASE